MTSEGFRAALNRMGLTQEGAARLLGVDPRTARRWACDERAIPEPVSRLLRASELYPGLIDALADD